MDSSFRESSPEWWLGKLLRQGWEATEYWFSQFDWPDTPEPPQWSVPQWLLDFLGLLAAGLKTLFTAPLTGLTLLLALAALLGWVWWTRGGGDRRFNPATALEPEASAKLAGTAAGWLEKARAEQQAQCYGKAFQALYCAMLLKLDEAEIVPEQPSRTDGEYRYLTQDLPTPAAPQLLLETHERLCFAKTPISSALFEQCLQAYGQLEQQIEQQVKLQMQHLGQKSAGGRS